MSAPSAKLAEIADWTQEQAASPIDGLFVLSSVDREADVVDVTSTGFEHQRHVFAFALHLLHRLQKSARFDDDCPFTREQLIAALSVLDDESVEVWQ